MFTVIIPTRNRPDFLAESVRSVLAQDYGDFELLVVNDGGDPVTTFQDRRIGVLDNQQRGAVAARNLGVGAARGTFIAFLDDDDQWIDRGFLGLAAAALATSEFVFADGEMRFPDEAQPLIFSQDADAHSLMRDNTILISAVCYARSLHETLGAFDKALPYYWDWDWYLRVARAGHRLRHLKKPVVDIRIHAQNMSGDSNVTARRANLDAFAAKHGLPPIALKNHADFVR